VERGNDIPTKGDRIEQTNLGIRRAGVVWYADQLQVLVKWDDGRSSSLRIGRDGFRIIEDVEQRKAADRYHELAALRPRKPARAY
jgi:hypothetical protein